MTDAAPEAPMVIEWVRSALEPWPLKLLFITRIAVPTEEHFAEVLQLNPALRGWGEPLG